MVDNKFNIMIIIDIQTLVKHLNPLKAHYLVFSFLFYILLLVKIYRGDIIKLTINLDSIMGDIKYDK